MQMTRLTLEQILSLKEHDGLLDVPPIASSNEGQKSRVIDDFNELNDFIDAHGFIPGKGQADRKLSIKERILLARLKGFKANSDRLQFLKIFDRHGVLGRSGGGQDDAPQSLDALLELDDDLLVSPTESIFTLRHTRPIAARPDRVSERRKAKDFEDFKPLFDKCVADLVSGKRKSIKFANEQEIEAGEFFILNGVMVYVAEVNDPHIRNGKRNARLRLIFENGTEGDNLLRSLATELYKDPNGRRISSTESGPLFRSRQNIIKVPSNGRVTGCIYVVKSLSPAFDVVRFEGKLFKIGFTTGSFEERIRSAKDDPTFLLAPVHPVRTYETINMNTNKFETLLHRFFGEARLEIEIMDRLGKPFRPREWFSVPLDVIDFAIPKFIDGTILRYKYDKGSERIVETIVR